MISRQLQRAVLDTPWQYAVLPPTFLLPLRARLTTTPNFIESNPPPQPFHSSQSPRAISHSQSPGTLQTYNATSTPSSSSAVPSAKIPTTDPSPTLRTLLPLLRAQPNHYMTAHIHARPYLITAGDTIRLPFHMPVVRPGDILRLNRASTIGSRDYTMRGAPYIDERLFECRATVVGTESEPMRFIEKTTRRNRRVRTKKAKMRFTVLRVAELRIKGLDEVAEVSGKSIEGETEVEAVAGNA